MALPFLESLGLTANEANLYEILLRLGQIPAGKLIKETNLKRATVYKSLATLEKKGLVSHKDVGKITHFQPESPSKLLELADAQHHRFDQARNDLRSALPQLTSSFILAVEKPVISSFEGVEGIKKVYESIVSEGKDILLLRSLYDNRPELSKLVRTQISRQVAAGIHTRTITPLVDDTKHTFEHEDRKRLVERHIVAKNDFTLPAQIIVFGQKVAIISLKKSIIATLIDNPDIADSFKQLFNLLWIGTESEHNEITSGWKQS